MKRRVLVVEDEDKLRRILELQLLDSGFDVEKASTAEEALPLIDRADLIITDFKLPGMTGFEMLQIIRRMDSHVPVIIMTAYGTVENAVEAMKAGASDFLLKPFSLDQLIAVVSKALEIRNLREENRQRKERLGRRYAWGKLVGRSRGRQRLYATVMLDEIGDVPANIQIKLLRVLQEREFERLGSNKTLHIDVRVIAATNRDLRVALEDGTFREDLYYRLNVVPIEIPPLRERKEDIPYLARHFVEKLAPDTGGRVQGITDAAIDKLMTYSWPGNVRELENVIERSIVMAPGEKLDADNIRLDMNLRSRHTSGEVGLPEGMSLDAYEQELIRNALKQANGNKSQAARILGLTRNALRYRLTQMGIES